MKKHVGPNRGYAVEQHRKKKAEAERRKIPFNLTVHDIEHLLDEANTCPVFNIPLERRKGRGGHDNTPSLDRVIPDKGYVISNVEIISWRANRIKHEATLDELRAIIDYVESHAQLVEWMITKGHWQP